MHVVVTAGHVDHGKSTLVRVLTGSDPDRLEEERRRGLSIELGYCWTSLDGLGEVAFVDVPGHERFIATTLSGMGPVPVAMLVVAADDPWMPQAAEHLAALDALGVAHGIVVVTRSDLADPAPALARARSEVDRTSLAGAPVVAVSGATGEGLDELRALLHKVLSGLPAPDPAADVRLWVDRRFHVKGSGTVVTGTLPAGTVRVGDVLEVGGREARVRGVEALGVAREAISGVARVALDLGGRAPEVARGDAVVTPGAFEPTTLVDVRVTGEGAVPAKPLLHVGSALLAVHARPLGDDLVRLSLERPLPLRVGDRAILRDPGSRALWGLEVLDPAPPPLRRRGAAGVRAATLRGHDGSLAAELEVRGVVRRSLLRRIGVPDGPLPDGAVETAGWLVGPRRAEELRQRLVALASTRPVAPAAAAHELGLPADDLVLAVVRPPLRLEQGRITTGSDVPAALRDAAARVCAETDGFAAVEAGRLDQLGLGPAELARLHGAGLLLRIDPRLALPPGADAAAVEVLRGLDQPFTTSAARQALGTSRRVVLPLLAHLDRTGRTVRLADDRRRLR
ncbi:SelB domain-containing protein [Nocardioides marmoribigeumensis]|uniref:Selenocysteine-specific elongation factor n=1 Tax=Nocardioides marmoribigeumensis TaxID=433649 RepID=A0ABU2BYD5_9ACTN|nr:SelB C-terminal domain-containing protein [Nocardioides marmoribigeumensis]MDR7363404.1 selenocysteine-specific elongation factor [Nocardioides marmoribigeumensis]